MRTGTSRNEPWKNHNYFLGYIRGCTAFYYRGYYGPLWESLLSNQYNRKSHLFFFRDPTEIPAESIDEFPDLHESLGPEALAKKNGNNQMANNLYSVKLGILPLEDAP